MNDTKKRIAQGTEIIKRNPNKDLTVFDLKFIKEESEKNSFDNSFGDILYNAIVNAYKCGLAMGTEGK